MNTLYYQTKTPIGFLYKWESNLKFLIQQQEILLIELIRTHYLNVRFESEVHLLMLVM